LSNSSAASGSGVPAQASQPAGFEERVVGVDGGQGHDHRIGDVQARDRQLAELRLHAVEPHLHHHPFGREFAEGADRPAPGTGRVRAVGRGVLADC
jgi:hypothetical protein